jgi:transcription elongation factor Elf1
MNKYRDNKYMNFKNAFSNNYDPCYVCGGEDGKGNHVENFYRSTAPHKFVSSRMRHGNYSRHVPNCRKPTTTYFFNADGDVNDSDNKYDKYDRYNRYESQVIRDTSGRALAHGLNKNKWEIVCTLCGLPNDKSHQKLSHLGNWEWRKKKKDKRIIHKLKKNTLTGSLRCVACGIAKDNHHIVNCVYMSPLKYKKENRYNEKKCKICGQSKEMHSGDFYHGFTPHVNMIVPR